MSATLINEFIARQRRNLIAGDLYKIARAIWCCERNHRRTTNSASEE